LCATLANPIPALAGQAENALLANYAGSWKGTGKITGPDPGTVVCRLTMKNSKTGALTYSGRCSFGGGAASFRGAMIYTDAQKRYEASTSAQGASATTIGKRQGNGVVFSATGMDTRYGTASSTLALAGNIRMTFKLVDEKGETSTSTVTFERS
jgi:hypothetical protein